MTSSIKLNWFVPRMNWLTKFNYISKIVLLGNAITIGPASDLLTNHSRMKTKSKFYHFKNCHQFIGKWNLWNERYLLMHAMQMDVLAQENQRFIVFHWRGFFTMCLSNAIFARNGNFPLFRCLYLQLFLSTVVLSATKCANNTINDNVQINRNL